MNTINDIADYVIRYANADDDNISLSNLQLQKLLYYIQAWSYGINGHPIFNGAFQAWVHGPANVDIFHRFKDTGKTLYSEITMKDILMRILKLTPQKIRKSSIWFWATT